MDPGALRSSLTQTVESSQVFERWILQKQPKIFNKMSKNWDEKKIRDLQRVYRKQDHDFFSWLLSSKTSSPSFMKTSRSVT